MSKRYNKTRILLIFWCLFIGIGAFIGGIAMLIKPDGTILHMQNMLPYFRKLPFSEALFQNYVFSGIALICVNGITNIIASIYLFIKKKIGILLGMVFGITLMLWICIQFYMFPSNILSISYFIFGFIQFVTGYTCLVSYKQNRFTIDINSFTNINTNAKELVVYFSRLGYTKKIAYEEANRLGASIYEIRTSEPISGTGGFWWCGFFAMRGKNMRIDKVDIDFSKFDHVTICSPVWVFGVSSPVKSFCKEARGKIKSVS